MKHQLIPDHKEGKQTDLRHSVTLHSPEEAEECFKRAYKRMLNPPVWHKLIGALGAEFSLTESHGKDVERLVRVNDYFRIALPGPGNATGDGYDWVKVDMVEDKTHPGADKESIGMRVRASRNPQKHEADTAHFFKNDATSTFVITREANTVSAFYHGRNEVINANTKKPADNIRNSIVALGALAGFSEVQWAALIKGFLKPEIGG